jgi:hypothetical protein
MLGARDYSLDVLQSRRNRVVVAFSWVDRNGRRRELAQGLRLAHGKIIGMQDFGRPRSAVTLMRLRTTFG